MRSHHICGIKCDSISQNTPIEKVMSNSILLNISFNKELKSIYYDKDTTEILKLNYIPSFKH